MFFSVTVSEIFTVSESDIIVSESDTIIDQIVSNSITQYQK